MARHQHDMRRLAGCGRRCACLVLLSTVLVGGLAVATAHGSQIISTSAVGNITLGVNAKGEAMLTYTSRGKVVHVLAWGAVNATAPNDDEEQVGLKLGYDGGYRKNFKTSAGARAALADLRGLQARMLRATAAGNNPVRWALAPRIAAAYALLAKRRAAAVDYWKTFTCPAYDGPPLAWKVTACKAPDGSYWAVQSWQRKLPNYGVRATPYEAAMEVHLSHWTGAIAQLTVGVNWAYKTYDHLFGTLSYHGSPVHGFRSTAEGQPLDRYGRNVYVDTFDSAYGPAWQRENSFLTHNPGGGFCYGFYPHDEHPAGSGTKYRATILGPGVAPDVMWEGVPPGPYDQDAQDRANRAILGLGDPLCRRV